MPASKTPTNTFNEISQQNSVVDAVVDGMVQTALERIEVDHQKRQNQRGDETEVKKTSLMLLLFGLLGK